MNSDGVKKNQSLIKALKILEEMTNYKGPVKLQDVAKSLNMSPSTILRFFNTFIDFGYIKRETETSNYYITMKLAALGSKVSNNFPFQNTLSKYVKEISEKFNESSSLCIENDMQMVYIAIEDSPRNMFKSLQRIGHIAPMHATGVGKIFLTEYSNEKLEKLIKIRGLKKITSQTICKLEDLKKELEVIKSQGYALDEEECEKGVRCVAVPIRNYTGQIVASISLSAPISRLDSTKTDEIIAFLQNISTRASKELGWENQISW